MLLCYVWTPLNAHIYGILHCNQFIIPSKATSCDTSHCSCLTINDFAVQDELVAVETWIDVGEYPMDLLRLPLYGRPRPPD